MKERSAFGEFVAAFQNNKTWFFLFTFFLILHRFISIIIPLYVGFLIDSLITTLQNSNSDDKLLYFIAILVGLNLIHYFARMSYFFSFGYFDTSIIKENRKIVFTNLQDQSMRFFEDESTGDLISIYARDLVDFSEGLRSVIQFWVNILHIGGIFVIIIILDPLISVIFLVFMPLLWYILKQFSEPYREIREQRQNEYGRMTKTLEENINTIKVVKAYNMQISQNLKFDQQNRKLTSLQKDLEQKRASLFPRSRIITQIFSVVLLILGGYRVANNYLTPGELIILILLISMLPEPINELASSVVQWNIVKVAHQRLKKIMYGLPDIKESENSIDVPEEFKGEIVFAEVNFSYKGEPTLEHISFTVKAATNIAVIGATGSGKTSILNLLLRFYDPTAGNIYLDGWNLNQFKILSLRSIIGLVDQETYLFSKSIRENIAIGKPTATFEEIQRAAKLACAHEFIMDLNDGYETIIGKKGFTLSGGQRQRISIARTILVDPKVIIFDDSLSAVDVITEMQIQEALDNLSRNKTTIVVTQRLNTLSKMDNIILLDDGKILEQGTHIELMETQGKYQELLQSQLGNVTAMENKI